MKPSSFCKAILLLSILSLDFHQMSAQSVTRGAYLQKGTQTSIVIRWRTNVATNSRVRIGPAYIAAGTYATIIDDPASVTEHIVTVSGLTADTKYFYSVGSSTTVLQVSTNNFFRTLPLLTATRAIRIAAFGDCGRNSTTYQDNNYTQYTTYLTANGIDAPDAWILLGDNAYSTGSDAEYTTNFFGIYGANILRNHKLYPALGNHDYANNTANKASRAMPWYSNFSTFQAAEAGGVASGKPNFYSFNVGPIHFLALDSWGIEADGSFLGQDTSLANTQFTWIKNDLAANTQKWTICYWHHPPYTKSSHNSDTEAELINMRTKFIKALEVRGVDMIICGHAHGYERGYLMKGFYTDWTTFNAGTHAVSTSSATYQSNATCPYVYNSTPANHGTLYVVAGSTGASGGTNAGFGANGFPFAVNDGGMLLLDVTENRLDAKMLRQNGTIFDRFTIMKDVNKTTNISIHNGLAADMTASWPQTGNYTWSPNVGTGRSVSPIPPNNATTNYTVTDQFGCVTDQFSVTTTATLPVELLNYDVRLVNREVHVNWTTATETNNDHFTIERSSNGRDFSAVGTVPGAGNSSTNLNYAYVDHAPLPGISYYRLTQTDIDNHVKYMSVKRIDNQDTKSFDVKVLNSASGFLTMEVSSTVSGQYEILVYDLSGRMLKSDDFILNGGRITRKLNLNKGVYIWEIHNEKGESVSQKVSIQ